MRNEQKMLGTWPRQASLKHRSGARQHRADATFAGGGGHLPGSPCRNGGGGYAQLPGWRLDPSPGHGQNRPAGGPKGGKDMMGQTRPAICIFKGFSTALKIDSSMALTVDRLFFLFCSPLWAPRLPISTFVMALRSWTSTRTEGKTRSQHHNRAS